VLLSLATSAFATWADASQSEGSKYSSNGSPYCGIYALYAALQSQGVDPRFEDLAQQKYVGSRWGSSLAELQQAAEDLGARAAPVQGLTASALRNAQHPIILHVRRPGTGTPYQHWMLFLGTDGSEACVVDPPNAMERMPFAELMSLSDGVGLLVAHEPADVRHLQWTTWVECAATFSFVIATVMAASQLMVRRSSAQPENTTRRQFLFKRLVGAIALVGLAVGLAGVFQLISPDGFFWNRTAVHCVVARYFEPSIRELDASELVSLFDSPGLTIVDARLRPDYEAGHIPGAVNLPITSGLAERKEVASRIAPRARVVVYCQSERCPWGRSVASDLYYRGFHDIAVLRGGWKEWSERVPDSQ
jgi:rhodanese-related sulfurtransferase/predicted double-glycine peptidase